MIHVAIVAICFRAATIVVGMPMIGIALNPVLDLLALFVNGSIHLRDPILDARERKMKAIAGSIGNVIASARVTQCVSAISALSIESSDSLCKWVTKA
jgi:hypothetical protein